MFYRFYMFILWCVFNQIIIVTRVFAKVFFVGHDPLPLGWRNFLAILLNVLVDGELKFERAITVFALEAGRRCSAYNFLGNKWNMVEVVVVCLVLDFRSEELFTRLTFEWFGYQAIGLQESR